VPYASSFELANIIIDRSQLRKSLMLYTIALVLVILWVLGLATSFTAGGLLHALLVIAIIMVLFQLISGRRIV
jgi:hypothetical protein